MKERQCHISSCERQYSKKLNHVKRYHKDDAYTKCIENHIDSKHGMCDICKIVFNDKPGDHVALRHRERAFEELAKTFE